MQKVKLDPAKSHEEYLKNFKEKKFDSIPLPTNLPPLNVKPQVEFTVTVIYRLQLVTLSVLYCIKGTIPRPNRRSKTAL